LRILPCHAGADPDTFNCLFCFCPLYFSRCLRRRPRPAARGQGLHGLSAASPGEGYDVILARLRDEAAKRRALDAEANEA
jgi:Zn-finger protein